MNPRTPMYVLALVLAGAGVVRPLAQSPQSPAKTLTVQITSPLGRTGIAGPTRIVARVASDPATVLSTVQFFVDGKLIGEDKDGAPYAIDWVDENPFLPREIVVTVADSLGQTKENLVKELKDLGPVLQSLADSGPSLEWLHSATSTPRFGTSNRSQAYNFHRRVLAENERVW